MLEAVGLFARGMLMGIADLIPGVSGGTMALITGIYDRFMRALSGCNFHCLKLLLTLRWNAAFTLIDWRFLLAIFAGILTAVALFSRAVHYVFTHHPEPTLAAFFGLSLAAALSLLNSIAFFRTPHLWLCTLLGFTIAFLFVGMQSWGATLPLWSLFFVGMLAAGVMLLPGISGSFLLLVLGQYVRIIEAIKNPFADQNLLIITTFAAGCALGIMAFSRIIHTLYQRFPATTAACLVGLMLGAMRKLWPWKEVLETKIIRGKMQVLREENIMPASFSTEVGITLLAGLAGFVFVVFLSRYKSKT